MAKLQKASSEELIKKILGIHIPSQYLEYFELFDVIDRQDCYELVLVEKEDIIPQELIGKDIVLDGFCNPITILSHSFSMKRIYLICKRRRWKERGQSEHYSNEYDLHENGAKITPHFASFLKMYDRIKTDQH
jgi:hypothetical protein